MAPTDLPTLWGERIRERRESAGLRASELARDVDISRAHLWKIENGKHTPSDYLRIRLARALHTTVPELFPHEAPEPLDAA